MYECIDVYMLSDAHSVPGVSDSGVTRKHDVRCATNCRTGTVTHARYAAPSGNLNLLRSSRRNYGEGSGELGRPSEFVSRMGRKRLKGRGGVSESPASVAAAGTASRVRARIASPISR